VAENGSLQAAAQSAINPKLAKITAILGYSFFLQYENQRDFFYYTGFNPKNTARGRNRALCLSSCLFPPA
jgi:hypothetical protein